MGNLVVGAGIAIAVFGGLGALVLKALAEGRKIEASGEQRRRAEEAAERPLPTHTEASGEDRGRAGR